MTTKTLIALLLSALIFAFPDHTSAATKSTIATVSNFTPCRPGAKVYYVNGVAKSNPIEVAAAAEELKSYIGYYGVGCVAEVDYLYNPSGTLLVDLLLEAAPLKALELGIPIQEAILGLTLSVMGIENIFGAAAQQEAVSLMSRLTERLVGGVPIPNFGSNTTIQGLVDRFSDRVLDDLGKGTKTILVGHSEGNIFANMVADTVKRRGPEAISRGLGVVNVANASLTAPSGLWVTALQDTIINGTPGALPGNRFDADGALGYDFTGHGFSEIYLNHLLPLSRFSPSSVTATNSLAEHVMGLLREGLAATQDPQGAIVGSTYSGLFEYDLATRQTRNRGSFAFAAGQSAQVWDIAKNPRTGEYFAISQDFIYRVDASTRLLTRLPQSFVGGNALAFNPDGELFSMNGDRIYRVDITTGVTQALPVTLGTLNSSGDLTFDNSGNMYGTAYAADGIDRLVRIDVNRNQMTVVGSTGYRDVYGLYFSGGSLYGVTTTGSLIGIDLSSGSGSLVARLGLSSISGLQ